METPIDRLDDYNDIQDANPDVANSILNKFNNMNIPQNGGYDGDLPPIHPDIPMMEHDMEQRNMNESLQNMQYMNPVMHIEAQKAYMAQQQRAQQYEQEQNQIEYVEEVVEEYPMWKKVLNELRIIIFVMIMTLFLFNTSFNKIIIQFLPFFRANNFSYDINLLGTVIKALLVGITSYLLIRFVRF